MIEDAIEYLGQDVNIEPDLTEMVLGAPSNGAEQIEKIIKGAADIVAEASIVIGGFDPLRRIKTASTVENDLRMMFSFAEADIKHMPHAAKRAVITRLARPKRLPKTKKKPAKKPVKKGRGDEGDDDMAAAAQADIDDFLMTSAVIEAPSELDLTNEIVTDNGFLDFIEGGDGAASTESPEGSNESEESSEADSDNDEDSSDTLDGESDANESDDDYLVEYTDIDGTDEAAEEPTEDHDETDDEAATEEHQLPF